MLGRGSEAPLRQIAENAGIDGGVVADEVSQKDLHTGYDANKGEYVDMVIKAGIIDPVKVVRVALIQMQQVSLACCLPQSARHQPRKRGRQETADRGFLFVNFVELLSTSLREWPTYP